MKVVGDEEDSRREFDTGRFVFVLCLFEGIKSIDESFPFKKRYLTKSVPRTNTE